MAILTSVKLVFLVPKVISKLVIGKIKDQGFARSSLENSTFQSNFTAKGHDSGPVVKKTNQ